MIIGRIGRGWIRAVAWAAGRRGAAHSICPIARISIKLPCLWKRLWKNGFQETLHFGKKIQINDSKVVYSPSDGLRELERGVLAIITAMAEIPADFHGMISRVADQALTDLAKYPGMPRRRPSGFRSNKTQFQSD